MLYKKKSYKERSLYLEALKYILESGPEFSVVDMQSFFWKHFDRRDIEEYRRSAKQLIAALKNESYIEIEDQETIKFKNDVDPHRVYEIKEITAKVKISIPGIDKAKEYIRSTNKLRKVRILLFGLSAFILTMFGIYEFIEKRLDTPIQKEKQVVIKDSIKETKDSMLIKLPVNNEINKY